LTRHTLVAYAVSSAARTMNRLAQTERFIRADTLYGDGWQIRVRVSPN